MTAEPPPRILRQERPATNRLGTAVLFGCLTWVILGAVVYWVRTGDGTIRGETLSDVGAIVLFGPLVLGAVVSVSGPIGPLRVLYEPPYEVNLGREGMGWRRRGDAGRTFAWEAVAGVTTFGDRTNRFTIVRDMQGDEVMRFSGDSFRDTRTGWAGPLAKAVVAVRPDRYDFVAGSILDRRASAVLRAASMS